MKKRIVSIILVFGIVISSCAPVVANETEAYKLNLSNAVIMALDNNLVLKQVSNEHSLSSVKEVTTQQLKNDLVGGQNTYNISVHDDSCNYDFYCTSCYYS